MNKILIALVIIVIGVSIYSYQTINGSPTPIADDTSVNTEYKPKMKTAKTDTNEAMVSFTSAESQANPSQQEKKAPQTKANTGLPFDLNLLGLIYSKVQDESIAQLEYEGTIGDFRVDEQIAQSEIYIARINKGSVVVEFESVDYEIRLGDLNSLEEQQLQVEFAQMSAKEIGSRPRQIEHIVQLLPNLFNDGGKVIIPGQNPNLFSAAKFKEGDVLLEVNGFNIDDDASFGELQAHIRKAQTLEFLVNRAGRRITLYLDIPSEALKM